MATFCIFFIGKKVEDTVSSAERKVTLEELIVYFNQTSDKLDDYIDDRKRTLLHKSSMSGDFKVVKYLVERGANIDARDDQHWTPIHWAIREGNFDICKYLIENGANTNAKTHSGWTLRHIAAICGHQEILQYLIDTGAITDENTVKNNFQIPTGNFEVRDETEAKMK